MLKVGGIWCSPFEIESKLVEHPAVLEAAVVGRVDHENLIKPEAFVVLKEGQVALEVTTPSSPGILRPVGSDNYVHVVMPMFVQW